VIKTVLERAISTPCQRAGNQTITIPGRKSLWLLPERRKEIMPIPKGLAARAVIETDCGKPKLYIEIREGNRFSNFYYTYTVVGRGRGRVVTPGTPRHRGFADSLEDAVEKIVKVMKTHAKRNRTEIQIQTTIRIYRKRLYRKLLSMRPDELGLTRVRALPDRRIQSNVNKRLSASYTPFTKRWQIITK
jgi:hypothetical protein